VPAKSGFVTMRVAGEKKRIVESINRLRGALARSRRFHLRSTKRSMANAALAASGRSSESKGVRSGSIQSPISAKTRKSAKDQPERQRNRHQRDESRRSHDTKPAGRRQVASKQGKSAGPVILWRGGDGQKPSL